MASLKRRVLNILIALDQLAWTVITLGHGHPDETISAAAWRLELAGRWQGKVFRPIIDTLFLPLERDHCRLSFESELWGRQLPQEYRSEVLNVPRTHRRH